ncbi:MAG: hypothetical protein N2645_13680 [Clostridia bacterium]|nr:hypothetical protein [Clostridia bacterium]
MDELTVMGLDEIERENTPLDDLESEFVNLIFVGIDGSGSMNLYTYDMIKALHEFKDALEASNEADEILIARADFRENQINAGGYKRIDELNTDFAADGMTPLYDVIIEGSDKLLRYMELLRQNGMRVKAVFSIFSDGEDTSSKYTIGDAINAIETLNAKEIVTAFIAFGGGASGIGDQLRFKNVLKVNSSAVELRKAFNCLSKSVIESSKSVTAKVDDFFV